MASKTVQLSKKKVINKDKLLVARINMAALINICKCNPDISRSGSKGFADKVKIERFRSIDSSGEVDKSVDIIRILKTKENAKARAELKRLADGAAYIKSADNIDELMIMIDGSEIIDEVDSDE